MTDSSESESWSDVDIAASLSLLADEIAPDVLGTEIGDAIVDGIAELTPASDAELRRETRAVVIRTLHDVWQGVRVDGSRDRLDPPMAAVVYARELARRGVELHALLRAYRVGHDAVERAWSIAADKLIPNAGLRAQTMERAFRFFFAYVDAIAVQLTEIYLEEHARFVRGSAAVREETARRLMSGQRMSASEASAGLGYEVSGWHVGFVVWVDGDDSESTRAAALESVANRVAASFGSGQQMLISRGWSVVWGWTKPPARRTQGKTVQLPPDVRVAVGGLAADLDGWLRTHREAVEARRVAQLMVSASASVVRHRDVALLGLLTADPSSARRFVELELGELAEDTELAVRLRSTLAVYFDENLSPIRTARRLGVNKNTVVYRIEQAEEILGHEVSGQRQELQAALQLAEIFGGPGPQVASAAE